MTCFPRDFAHGRFRKIRSHFWRHAPQIPQLYFYEKKLLCKYGHENIFNSQFEPAEKDPTLRINIGTSFGNSFDVYCSGAFSKKRASVGNARAAKRA